MSKLTAFVKLDFFTLKPYAKSYLAMLILSVVMGINFNSVALLSSYFMMCLVLSLTYPFSIGETNKLDTLYGTLSLDRMKVVAGRYIFAVCMETIVVLLVWFLAIVISYFGFFTYTASELVVSLCVMSTIFSIMLSIQYPIYFKLGYNKAKFLAYIPLFVGIIGFFMVYGMVKRIGVDDKLIEDFFSKLMDSRYLLFALPIAGHLLMVLSYKVSSRFYMKRDI